MGNNSPLIYLFFFHRKGARVGINLTAEEMGAYQKSGFKWILGEMP